MPHSQHKVPALEECQCGKSLKRRILSYACFINLQGAFKGLSMFGEAMVNSVTGCKPPTIKRECVQLDNGNRPGIVTVVDIQNIHNDHVSEQPLMSSSMYSSYHIEIRHTLN